MPGTIPAINILDTDNPVMVAAMIMGREGGMMGPMQLDAAVTATEKSASYPRSTIMGISMPPSATVSDRAVPEIPAKIMEAMMLAYAMPPVRCPTSLSQKSISLSEIPPWFIRLPASVKPGMHKRVKLSSPAKNLCENVAMGMLAPRK